MSPRRDLQSLGNMCNRPFEVPTSLRSNDFYPEVVKKRRKFPINFDKRGPTTKNKRCILVGARGKFVCCPKAEIVTVH